MISNNETTKTEMIFHKITNNHLAKLVLGAPSRNAKPQLGLWMGFIVPTVYVTAIKLAAHRDVGACFRLRPDTYRSLKAAPTGLNLTAVTPERGNDKIYRIIL